MLWITSLHIFFLIGWFAGLFYLPRIMVNLAQETDTVAVSRLLGMARRLYSFTTIMSIPALLLGVWLLLLSGIGMSGPGNGWLQVKLGLVVLVIGYQHACGLLLRKFELGENKRSHVWLRWFNEVPTILLLAIVILVVVKPF